MKENLELSISFRNPIEFINQWWVPKDKFRAIFIWLLWSWAKDMCGVWEDYGIRIIGVEINLRRYKCC